MAGGLAIILEKAKKAKAGKAAPEMDEDLEAEEPESEDMDPAEDEESDGGLEAMKLFESAGSTAEKLRAFKMLMKACKADY